MQAIGKKMRCSRKGVVLAIVLSILVIFLVTGLGLLTLSLHGQLQAIRTGTEIMARSAADAGLTMGLFRMNEKLNVEPWNDNTLPQELDVVLANLATYGFTVEKTNGVYAIKSTGSKGIATRTVRAELRLAGLFEDAFFVEDSLKLDSKTIVDGYNSEDGPYGGTNSLKPTTICTNAISHGAINVAHVDTIYGDIIVGTTAHPENAVVIGNGHITGDIYAGEGPRILPAVVPPDIPNPTGQVDIDGGKRLGAGHYKWTGEAQLEEGKLVITGPVVLHVTGELETEEAWFEIVDGGSLTLYIDGEIAPEDPGFIDLRNLTEDPRNLQIYRQAGGRLPIGSTGQFYGTVYAPNANVQLYTTGGNDIYGAFVADSMTQYGSGDIHCDQGLRNRVPGEPGGHFVVSRWWEE